MSESAPEADDMPFRIGKFFCRYCQQSFPRSIRKSARSCDPDWPTCLECTRTHPFPVTLVEIAFAEGDPVPTIAELSRPSASGASGTLKRRPHVWFTQFQKEK